MPRPTVTIASLAFAIALATACSDQTSPTSPREAPPARASFLHTVQVSGPDEIPLEDGEVLPAAFHNATLIDQYHLDVGYRKPDFYATARMRYFATHGRVVVRLTIKRGDNIIQTDSAVAYNEELVPMWSDISAPKVLSVADTCGYRGDGDARYTAWMAFPIPRTGTLFAWGTDTRSSSLTHSQNPCAQAINDYSGPAAGGGSELEEFLANSGSDEDGDEPYEGNCQNCQLWFAMVGGYVTNIWWECSDVDEEFCELIEDVY